MIRRISFVAVFVGSRPGSLSCMWLIPLHHAVVLLKIAKWKRYVQTTSKFVLQLRSARGHRHCPCGFHVSVSHQSVSPKASSSKVRHLLAIRSAGPEINPDRRPTFELTGYLSPRAYNACYGTTTQHGFLSSSMADRVFVVAEHAINTATP